MATHGGEATRLQFIPAKRRTTVFSIMLEQGKIERHEKKSWGSYASIWYTYTPQASAQERQAHLESLQANDYNDNLERLQMASFLTVFQKMQLNITRPKPDNLMPAQQLEEKLVLFPRLQGEFRAACARYLGFKI